MQAERFDALILGTGQAGPSLAVRLAKAGKRVAVVERKSFGGTCVNTGCMPTKTMVASARVAHLARRAAEFGVLFEGPIRVDMKTVIARAQAIVHQSSHGVETWLRGAGCTVVQGHGRFESAHRVRVQVPGGDDRVLEADSIFVDVGGRANVPNIPGLAEARFLTNVDVVALDELPEHLVILGGSYIALEFAQMFRRFGSKVTVLERAERLLGKDDEDVAAAIRSILEGEGITVVTGAAVSKVEMREGRPVVHVAGGEHEGSHLLVALGRVPNTHDLGLELAGIDTDEHGFLRVDDELRTSVPGVWALGDCNGKGAFTHTSYNDYEIVAANVLDGASRKVSDRIQAYALYIDPPLGRVGLSEREVRERGRPALVARFPMARVGRARERGETLGFMKVFVDAETQRILGASLLGIEADEVVQVLLDVMYADAPYTLFQRAMHIHPTVAEFLPTLFEQLEALV